VPKIFEYNGFKFFFFSNEGEPREPLHVHVRKAGALAKVWLHPEIELAENHGFSASDLRIILAEVDKRKIEIREAWHAYFD
jgi:hypothetical protein